MINYDQDSYTYSSNVLINWKEEDFNLIIYYDHNDDNRQYFRYALYDKNVQIFAGNDYSIPAWIYFDNPEMIVSNLLTFLSLQLGDTDPDYFNSYTPAQLAWSKSYRAELLGYYAMELEENA